MTNYHPVTKEELNTCEYLKHYCTGNGDCCPNGSKGMCSTEICLNLPQRTSPPARLALLEAWIKDQPCPWIPGTDTRVLDARDTLTIIKRLRENPEAVREQRKAEALRSGT